MWGALGKPRELFLVLLGYLLCPLGILCGYLGTALSILWGYIEGTLGYHCGTFVYKGGYKVVLD